MALNCWRVLAIMILYFAVLAVVVVSAYHWHDAWVCCAESVCGFFGTLIGLSRVR